MKNQKTFHGSFYRAAVLAAAFLALAAAACTMVLTKDVEGTSAGSGGVLDPMLSIFEAELNASYSAARSLAPSSRGLAGGANSILHGLPSTTVAKVREKVRGTIVASGLERSRDIAKVAPAISEATAAALKDPAVVGTLAETDFVQVNAVSTRALAKSLNAASVTAVAEGLGTESEKTARLEALTKASTGNVGGFGLTAVNARDALQKLVLVVVESGNADVSAAGSTAPGATAPETLLAARLSAVMKIAASRFDDSTRFPGATCSAALNGLANAAVVGLAATAISGVADTKLQGVVQDGVLAGLFLAYYGFAQNVGVTSGDLRAAIDFADAVTALAAGAYKDSVNAKVQAARATIVPAADAKARKSVIITSVAPPAIDINSALDAATVAAGATTTWDSGSAIHVSSSITVNGSLVIGSGVTVYLNAGVSITVASTGSIQAQGTAASPIIFTRATSGSAWGSLRISSNSSSNSLAYCDISGGTIGVEIAYYSTDPGIATISNCLFHNNASNGLEAADAKSDLGRITTVRSCYFYANARYPALVNQYVDLDGSNHFYNPDTETAPAATAQRNALQFSGAVDSTVNLGMTEVPYYFASTLDIGNTVTGSVLAVGPGAVLKFALGAQVNVKSGSSMTASGTAAAPVVFTSINDDLRGDTNAAATAAVAGDWNGLQIMSSGNDLDYAELRYASTAMYFDNYYPQCAVDIANCVFRDNTTGFNGTQARPVTSITSTYFYRSSSFPVILNHNVAFDATNHFYDPSSASAPAPATKYNAVMFAGNVNAPVEMPVTEVPYYIPATISIGNSVSGSVLTVKAGAVLKFAIAAQLDVNSGSTLLVQGGVAAPAVLTSINDDQLGDTNGSAVAAAAGDWAGVRIMSAGNSLDRTELRYASTGMYFSSYYPQCAVTISGCVFRDNTTGFNGTEARPVTSIGSSYFYRSSSYPVILNQNISFDATNHFYDPGVAAAPDPATKYNAVCFSGDVNSAVAFPITEVPYYFPANLRVGNSTAGSSLTITPGAVLKFAMGKELDVCYGSSISASGTAEKPIIFTANADDARLGDTNGIAGSPTAGNWGGVDPMSLAASDVFAHCAFDYATTGLWIDNYYKGSALVSNSSFSHNSAGGVDARYASAGMRVTGSVFSDNGANGTSVWDIDTGASGNVNVTTLGNSGAVTRPAALP